MTTDVENVILVAFTVRAGDMEEAQRNLMTSLPIPGYGGIEEWWIAMDERYDGSDNDNLSAVFVPEGLGQRNANRELRALAKKDQRIIILDPEEDLTGTFTFTTRERFEEIVSRLHMAVSQ